MKDKNDKIIQSVDRAIQILECFDNNEELGVTEISKMVGLHKSTTFGLIFTLEAKKLLEKNEATGKYRLGTELFRIGTKVNSSLRKVASPYLKSLLKLYQETVNLVLLNDLSVIYLEKEEGTRSIYISTNVGGAMPIYCTAVGKAILAFLSEKERIDKVNRLKLKKFTENTISDKAELIKTLEIIRDRGYAQEVQEMEMGLCCVAAPIFNHLGNPFAAISVSGPVSRMSDQYREEIGGTLIQYTQEISAKIGY